MSFKIHEQKRDGQHLSQQMAYHNDYFCLYTQGLNACVFLLS